MSDAALDHPAVRAYLTELDRALAALPSSQARELREQITAHLDDALRPGADDHEVARALSRLGTPAEITAEAVPDGGLASAAFGHHARPARGRRHFGLRRLSWRARALIITAAVLVVAAAGYGIAAATAPPLQQGGAQSWWYLRDSGHPVGTYADGVSQTTVPIRSGQQQGFVITVYNPGSWTQTVLGPVANFSGPGGGTAADIGVAGPNITISRGGGDFRHLRYGLPGTIPPHQTRALRVLWTSVACLDQGSSEGIDELSLRVRVGLFTRTETVSRDQGWYVSGPSRGHCG